MNENNDLSPLRSTNSLNELPDFTNDSTASFRQKINKVSSTDVPVDLDLKLKFSNNRVYSDSVFCDVSFSSSPPSRATFLPRQCSFDEGGEARLSSTQVRDVLKLFL